MIIIIQTPSKVANHPVVVVVVQDRVIDSASWEVDNGGRRCSYRILPLAEGQQLSERLSKGDKSFPDQIAEFLVQQEHQNGGDSGVLERVYGAHRVSGGECECT